MIRARIAYREFQFLRPATTSRGTLRKKKVNFIVLYYADDPDIAGIGECSLFPGLSVDDHKEFGIRLQDTVDGINRGDYGNNPALSAWPSLNFALETAWRDLRSGGNRILYPSDFTGGKDSIPINGLIWMGTKDDMKQQIREKLEHGYSCIKIKIGALTLDEELELLGYLRKQFGPEELEIRVDANGAFKRREVLEVLKMLSAFDLHSIEQPIAPGHPEAMAEICGLSPVPVALDEELIGQHTSAAKRKILDIIRPQYVVLKPGMLGGIASCNEWITLCNERKTGWWITSALETNIGLNTIAQWTYTLGNTMAQGLSTGSLFVENIPSPLFLSGEWLYYDPDRKWDLTSLTDTLPL
jgi:O-succinylbenzoate synthase